MHAPVCVYITSMLSAIGGMGRKRGQGSTFIAYMSRDIYVGLARIVYKPRICRVGQNHTFIGIYGVHTVFLAGKPPCIRSYTVQISVLANPTYMTVCLVISLQKMACMHAA